MGKNDPDLAALIGSRICHDLISPIGAIGNGVELLTMSQETPSPEIGLISDSVDNANARIRYYRIAFGIASPVQMVGKSELSTLVKDMFGDSRMEIDWLPEGDCSRREARALFLLLLCAETMTPYGGSVSIRRDGDTWELSATSDKLKVEDALFEAMHGQAPEDLTAAQVHFPLLSRVLTEMGRTLSSDRTDMRVVFSF